MLFRTDLLTALTLHRIPLHVSDAFILKVLGGLFQLKNQNTTRHCFWWWRVQKQCSFFSGVCVAGISSGSMGTQTRQLRLLFGVKAHLHLKGCVGPWEVVTLFLLVKWKLVLKITRVFFFPQLKDYSREQVFPSALDSETYFKKKCIIVF